VVKLNPEAAEFVRSPLPPVESDADQAEQFVNGLNLLHNLTASNAPLLASMISTLPAALPDQPIEVACPGCEKHVANERRCANEIHFIREGWKYERQKHMETYLRLQELQTIIKACDAAYRATSFQRNGTFASNIPLSQIARDTIASYYQTQREMELNDTIKAIEQTRAKLKQRSSELIRANWNYNHFASKFEDQMKLWQKWLDKRSSWLEQNYTKYCEIMKEEGAKPEMLYSESDSIDAAKQSYLAALHERQEAARRAVETAYLDGCPDMLEDVFDG